MVICYAIKKIIDLDLNKKLSTYLQFRSSYYNYARTNTNMNICIFNMKKMPTVHSCSSLVTTQDKHYKKALTAGVHWINSIYNHAYKPHLKASTLITWDKTGEITETGAHETGSRITK